MVLLTAQPGNLTAGSPALAEVAAVGKTIAMHIAAAKPKYASIAEIPKVCRVTILSRTAASLLQLPVPCPLSPVP